MTMMASSLALETLMNALVSTAAKMAAEQESRAFTYSLAELRESYTFEELEPITFETNMPAMAVAPVIGD